MNVTKYEERLPMLRISKAILDALLEQAQAQQISLAEAHRQALAKGVSRSVMIPIVGTVDINDDGKITYFDEREAA